MEKYHIGKEIESEVRRQYSSIDIFAKALNRERQTVYDIFKRTHIATDRLIEVSKILNRDFFKEFSEHFMKGTALTTETNEESITESISQLMPEDELQIVRTELIQDIADEYFLSKRKKPIVIFTDNTPNNATDIFNQKGEKILGLGMIKNVRTSYKDLPSFEIMAKYWNDIPHKGIAIHYDSSDKNGCDEIILIAEQLASSGKFIIVFCHCINELGCDNNKHIIYNDMAERCFAAWHNRIHALVADNVQKDFARRQELYHASISNGYIDRAYKLLEQGNNVAARMVLQKALFKRSTYTFTHEDVEDNLHRFYATSAVMTLEEHKLFELCGINPHLTMWFDISKIHGEIERYGNY